nr:PREDICTED: protein CASC5 [Struthio camelus australis]
MDKTYSDPNMENDNTERIRGKRLSSILKAPRSPLHDLGNGNEFTQDVNMEKRRKNSRRVSFADTINCRVFQRDLKTNVTERENTECAADTRKQVLLNQNEEPEAVQCEITGMDTLLHAPIQALVQQTEWHDADTTFQRTNRHDTTLIFSDENEMDMTASHTAVITRDLKSNQTDKAEKIDITSFLAGLKTNNGKSEMNKEFHFFCDPTNHSCPSSEEKPDAMTVKKINFNEFLMSLKSNEKVLNPTEGPEKENLFFVPSQVSEDMARASVEYIYSHEPEATCNVTKIFREQDDGMEMTKCQASDVKTIFSGICEAPPEQLVCADVTEAFVDVGMDMTISHTAKMSFSFSGVENQSLNFKKDFPATELDNNSILKRPSNPQLMVQEEPQLCTDKKIVNVENRLDTPALQSVEQQARTMSAIPGSISSDTVFRGDKTLVFSTCDDMEITGNYTGVIDNESTKEISSSCSKAIEKTVNTNSSVVENTHPAPDDDRDITKSLVSSDNRSSMPYKNSALVLFSGSDERTEKVTQDHGSASMNVGFDSHANSVSNGICKGRLQHRLANSLLVSLPGEKTVIFSGEDMDLTKTCVLKDERRNVENEFPAGVSSSFACKPHFLGITSTSPNLNDQEEMEITKCQAVVIDDQSTGIRAEAKQMHNKIIPSKNENKDDREVSDSFNMDNENVEVMDIDVNVKSRHSIEMNTTDFEVLVVDKKLGKTNFLASALSSSAKKVCSFQEQKKEVPKNVITNNCAFMSSQKQNIGVSQSFQKNPLNASLSCTNDQTAMLSDDQNMDITKTHTAALDVVPINTVQDHENNHSQSNVISKQLQNKTFLFSGGSDADITISQTAAIECGVFKMNSDKPTVVPFAPNGSFISSNEPVPPGIKGDEQLGKILGMNTNYQNSDKQEKTRTMEGVNKVLSGEVDSRRDFWTSKTVSSKEDLKNPHSVDSRLLKCAEEPLLANTAEPPKGNSRLPSFLEKSVVFSSDENMDLTESCLVKVPDQNINTVLPERKAVPRHVVQDENNTLSLKKEDKMTVNSQEQSGCHADSLVSAKKTLAVTDTKHFSRLGEKTTIFSDDADMDITRNHTVAADNKIILQPRSSDSDITLNPEDKTCIFTYSNDMEITRLDTVVIDKSMEKAASQGMLSIANRPGRKSLRGATGEKTVLFSLNEEENDMEITQSHTAAIGHETASQDKVTFGTVSQSQVEIHEGEDPPNQSSKSPDCTQANTSSSLDSVKADTELTIQRSSHMESQLLTDSICEDNLWEKFQNGVITVGEFFTLLQVHIPIQKPRQSHLPANYAMSTPPTPEDLIFSQYVYRPKLRIYEEDCQVLSQMIEELKPYASVQDQLLVNVNKSLWEVMRTCSDEELKSFGAELNKMKSYFTKESKILAHNGKVTLYSKLLQSSQEQWEKLQSRIAKVDEILKEADSCLAALEADSDWEECEADCNDEMAEQESKGRNLEEELETLRAEEEELQRDLLELETQNKQVLAEINRLQKKEKSCQELLEAYNFTEWEISEWSEQQAVFNFLYDSIEFTVVFGSPIDGDVFGENPCRKIVSMSFESLLDEEKAPLSSRLVQRLIFQFIESQGCWQERCPTLHYLPQVLHDISLVVSRCKVLGEEIEFLKRWGGKFNLLKTDINDTKVKLLFSTSTAFAKFELTLSLSANYPSASLPFTVQSQIGNIGEEEISAVLSKVPLGYHYLRRIVSLIHHHLLQDPR